MKINKILERMNEFKTLLVFRHTFRLANERKSATLLLPALVFSFMLFSCSKSNPTMMMKNKQTLIAELDFDISPLLEENESKALTSTEVIKDEWILPDKEFEEEYSKRDQDGNTKLHTLCLKEENMNIILKEEKNLYNPDPRNHDAQTPLMLACKNGNLFNISMLLDINANPELVDKGRNNLFHFLVLGYKESKKENKGHYLDCVDRLFIEVPHLANKPNYYGYHPLDYCVKNSPLYNVMISNGANKSDYLIVKAFKYCFSCSPKSCCKSLIHINLGEFKFIDNALKKIGGPMSVHLNEMKFESVNLDNKMNMTNEFVGMLKKKNS